MDAPLRLRLRGPEGKQHTISLPAKSTLADLQKEAQGVFSFGAGNIEFLLGFPPVLCNAAPGTSLSELLCSGDTVTVRGPLLETAPALAPPPKNVCPDACSDSGFELEVLRALSRARSNPSSVLDAICKRRQHYQGKDYFPPDRGGKTAVVTKEGQAAVLDAIGFLGSIAPHPPLSEVCIQGLRLAAEDHLLDLGQRGAVGHEGADGSSSSDRQCRYGAWGGKSGECLWFGRMGTSATQIVEDLIVDDGVPTRGHRKGIYDPRFEVAGVRMGPHKTFGACCVIEFASRYEDNEQELIKRVCAGPPAVAAGKAVKTQWQLGQCPGCKEAIHGGSVMEALGHKWHRDCFACQADGCGLKLCGVPYQENNGMPFCKDCYYKSFGSTCSGCGEKIHGRVMKNAGQTWHEECWVPAKGKAAPPVSGYRRPPAARNTAPTSRIAGSAHPKTPPPKVGARARTPPPAISGAQARTPPPVKSGALPKIGAGRGTVAKATPNKVPMGVMGSAKSNVTALGMSYANLE